MNTFILIVGLVLLAFARHDPRPGAQRPARRVDRDVEQIGAYGFGGFVVSRRRSARRRPRARSRRRSRRSAAGSARASATARTRTTAARLIAAGWYSTTPDGVLGYQAPRRGRRHLRSAAPRALAGGCSTWLVVLGYRRRGRSSAGTCRVDRRLAEARKRHHADRRGLPELIDLLVVTVEAGIELHRSSLRLAATKIKGPLAQELRLTLQEQSMGLDVSRRSTTSLSRARHAGRSRCSSAVDHPGRDARRLDQPDPAQPRRRDAQAAQGASRGARAEGAGQDALPAHLPDLPGDVRRPPPPRAHPDREGALGRAARCDAVPNLTLRREDGRIVCESVTVADTTLRRMRGLLGRARPPVGRRDRAPARLVDPHGLHALPDRRRLHRPRPGRDEDRATLRPFKTASCRGAREVVELRAGECERRGLSARRPRRLGLAQRRRGDSTSESRRRRRASGAEPSSSRARPALRQARRGSCSRARGSPSARACRPRRAAAARASEPTSTPSCSTRRRASPTASGCAHVTRARRPEATVVLVGESPASRRRPRARLRQMGGDRGVVAAIEDALAHESGVDARLRCGSGTGNRAAVERRRRATGTVYGAGRRREPRRAGAGWIREGRRRIGPEAHA